jgi:hypothetical protein
LNWTLVIEDVGAFIIDSGGNADFSKEQLWRNMQKSDPSDSE